MSKGKKEGRPCRGGRESPRSRTDKAVMELVARAAGTLLSMWSGRRNVPVSMGGVIG